MSDNTHELIRQHDAFYQVLPYYILHYSNYLRGRTPIGSSRRWAFRDGTARHRVVPAVRMAWNRNGSLNQLPLRWLAVEMNRLRL